MCSFISDWRLNCLLKVFVLIKLTISGINSWETTLKINSQARETIVIVIKQNRWSYNYIFYAFKAFLSSLIISDVYLAVIKIIK